ncbi:type II toxin-antitoxin system Phd/YefM family antitoxin [Aurantimonas sp. C2-6-R+9]|uniref:type II toxin-antitoxin system Phd/YefM family antitoxin n=1 Tax=unclassified Aurantimonas TaxID=2638230 RepID=UPI002E193C1B|nr:MULTISPECIES: type II toxin-antitoxin system Phd/YefM family antitoxin [unclassified Aurantimonas]MEC5289810.1 type II toxin-antitoxin system Phd/YefM family antitoxin [Aurantimonas sp. C2-3-R2]MEC5322376.1 type II toxin-antitoxin system Phd/YefM family antitoxin [Aurantimonas sp. A3-2-R12]MEC5379777.1 type II toxin-antitoxin system Phd/YefM family antitoxin [Aurantimonas sp. C2-6-R+9]MEC5410751.1 type II toxin-antitoxin system Phd/YefM family antitoxin [Aurantimonas sp. C2-4-R8]
MQTFGSRAFNQQHGRVKEAARKAPVRITERGEPAFVLMSEAEYRRLSRQRPTLLDFLADPRPEADFDFSPERVDIATRDVDLG